jgi:hypothetical protein
MTRSLSLARFIRENALISAVINACGKLARRALTDTTSRKTRAESAAERVGLRISFKIDHQRAVINK